MQFKTLKRADSVLRKGLKLTERHLRYDSYSKITEVGKTAFSKILEIKGTTDIGRKLLKSEVTKEGFLSRGVTVATFRHVGTEPVSKHLFKRDSRPGPTESTTSLKKQGCITSWGQNEVLRLAIISVKWRGEIGSKTSHEVNGWVETQAPTYGGIACGLSLEILSMK